MENYKIKVFNLETGETTITDDFYWFEENGVRYIKADGSAESFCGTFKIEFYIPKKEEDK